MNQYNKMGFWAVLSIVLSSQIGSGIFMLPAGLAAYGGLGAASWLISGSGAILLALVFAELCKSFPKTGGPHVYVQAAFGQHVGFFAAWAYWLISWLSSSVVIIAAVGYFSALFGGFSPMTNLMCEITMTLAFMGLNLLGVRTSGRTEFIFTLLKIVPLVLLPLACIAYFNVDHFQPFNPTGLAPSHALNAAALLTFWGFIGIEIATTPAGAVKNPEKTIPKAIVLGTISVALIYFISSAAVMGVVPPQQLAVSQAPFTDATRIIFGGNWHMGIAVAAGIVCMGTLNAWILASGQIALGAAQDGLFPKFFKRQNVHGAPLWGVVISSLGVIPLLLFTLKPNLIDQLTRIIDDSVTTFLCIYSLCTISYLKISYQQRMPLIKKMMGWGALGFCAWGLMASTPGMLGFAALSFSSGLPVYFWMRSTQKTLT